jgi:hypothetical protein
MLYKLHYQFINIYLFVHPSVHAFICSCLHSVPHSCICSFQAAEEEEAAERLLLQQQQALRSAGSKGGGAFQPWRGGQGAAADAHQDSAAGSPGDEPSRSLGFDLRPKVQT